MEGSTVDLRDNGMDWTVGFVRRKSHGVRVEMRPIWRGVGFDGASERSVVWLEELIRSMPFRISSECDNL